jgi:hypothetical protein
MRRLQHVRRLHRNIGFALLVAGVIAVSASCDVLGSTSSTSPGPVGSGSGLAAAATSTALPSLSPAPSDLPSPSAAPTPAASPTTTPAPVRSAVDVNIEALPKAVFKTEVKDIWCAAAAVQMTLNVIGPRIDVTTARQQQIRLIEVANTTRADSRSGGVGPLGMVATLNKLGSVRYELRVYRTRVDALRDAARAISATGHPVILMAWYGAHAWVMTGYRADADPLQFADANVQGAYILDAWYPRVSTIWGRSDPPGTYQDAAEMKRNYLPWKRPEAHYIGLDGKFLALVPADGPAS